MSPTCINEVRGKFKNMYTHLCARTQARMHTGTHIVHLYIHVQMHTCTHTSTSASTHSNKQAQALIQTHTLSHMHMDSLTRIGWGLPHRERQVKRVCTHYGWGMPHTMSTRSYLTLVTQAATHHLSPPLFLISVMQVTLAYLGLTKSWMIWIYKVRNLTLPNFYHLALTIRKYLFYIHLSQ